MDSLNFLGSAMPLGVTLVMCVCAVGIIGIVVAGVFWGLRHGKVRVVKNERNFDDFGR